MYDIFRHAEMNLSLKIAQPIKRQASCEDVVESKEWQASCEDVKTRIKYLLGNEKWTDCLFVVGCESNQIKIEGHKLLLASASPVFEAIFYGSMPEMDEIVIPDIEPKIFQDLLQYIYSDEVIINTISNALGLYCAAKKYMLPHLSQVCMKYMINNLKPNNVCQVYEIAKVFDETTLISRCIEKISTHTLDVLSDSSFEEIQICDDYFTNCSYQLSHGYYIISRV